MLEPREADIPVLFLVLVVLPLVAYFLLGKWSDAAEKRERVSLLSQLAIEETLSAESMTTCAIPLVPTSNNGILVCAGCFRPATTRCARCKSVRYCSGKCQIIHWRQVHRHECQLLETATSCSSPKATSAEDSISEGFSISNCLNSFLFGTNNKQGMVDGAPSDDVVDPLMSIGAFAANNFFAVDTSQGAMLCGSSRYRQVSCKSNREMLRRAEEAGFGPVQEASEIRPSNTDCSSMYFNGQVNAGTMHETRKYAQGSMSRSRKKHEFSSSLYSGKNGTSPHEIEVNSTSNGRHFPTVESIINEEAVKLRGSSEMTTTSGSIKSKSAMPPLGVGNSKSSISMIRASGQLPCPEIEGKAQITDDSKVTRTRDRISASGSNGVACNDIMKMVGLRESTKLAKQDTPVPCSIRDKTKVLFPYEEFVKIFNCEFVSLSPKGLLNCGNSCYANAVLQCLACTKPLTIFLLRRSHSRACFGKDWCLMCELEQLVTMLRAIGGPLSPSRILLHMQNSNCQIGDGSQEDAHEFLRLVVASMQTICLEGLGGEDKVHPGLQETTFIQHIFGGHLRSKVKCLRCHCESERYENIMDLTLEISGWVKSLEDALTQFTSSEELDGENMYRCGSCAAYVQARKQLSIHEAPNILTIVLKRFQEGKYGKINKYISFPEMLDITPFMTGMGDVPHLYMLYAVVVHLDTLNASFTGHYVAYVKDLQGIWFRMDDTEVHPVPIDHVMSEGAYILFYMRRYPRPPREFKEIAIRQKVPINASQRPSRRGQSKSSCDFVGSEPSLDLKPENIRGLSSHAYGISKKKPNREIDHVDFSDATSSDWSLFTSSDDASFTTESARDSLSTMDNADMFSSIFNNLRAPESSSSAIFCRSLPSGKAETRFSSEEKGYVLDSFFSNHPAKRMWRIENFKKVGDSLAELDGSYGSVKYGRSTS